MMALMHLAQNPERLACSAREISDTYRIPAELMAKILQKLAKKGLLISQQGIAGGYSLGRPANSISAALVIEAIEGPLSMTSCVSGDSFCLQFERCNVKTPLQRLHEGVIQMLGQLTIEQMAQQWPISFKLPLGGEKPGVQRVVPFPSGADKKDPLPVLQDA